MTLGGAGHNRSAPTGYKAAVAARATEAWTPSANGSRLTLETTPNGSSSRVIAWSINQDGSISHESTGRKLVVGSGSPEGVITANIGSEYWRTDGGLGTSRYIKESGNATSSGWVAHGNTVSLSGSVTWDIPNLASLANSSTTITVTGAVVGDMVVVSPAMPSAGVVVAGDVTSADTVTIRGHNASGGAVDPPSTTYRVKVIRQ